MSPVQFYEGDGEHCRKWLRAAEHGGPAAVPEMGLEIAEGLLLASDPDVLKQLLAFQQAGIKISLDDFGTGYSSLSYLCKFALDFLKIGKSFVFNLEYDAANVALCEAIIVMAHKLGLRVVVASRRASRPRCCAAPAATSPRATCLATRCRRTRSRAC